MADKILVSTAEMNAAITKYNNALQTMQGAQKNMTSALHNLMNCWKGAAATGMLAKWANIEQNIVRGQLAVTRCIANLQATIQNYESHEQENKTTGSGLETGNNTNVFVD